MRTKPSATLMKAFQAEAEARYPNEACGFVVKAGKKQQFIPCENTDPNPGSFFRISEDDYARAADIGEVIAVWHSHPNGSNLPSDSDRVECENSELPWFINGITKSDEEGFLMTDTSLLEPSGFKMEYIGRPYHYGLIDCYSLLVDYFQGEYGIKLEQLRHTRDTRFWESDEPMMEKHYAGLGFEQVYDTAQQAGDVFLIQTGGKVANHVAIYIGDDMILHHCENRLSGRSIYGGYWHKHTVKHLRHPGVLANVNKGDS